MHKDRVEKEKLKFILSYLVNEEHNLEQGGIRNFKKDEVCRSLIFIPFSYIPLWYLGPSY